MKTARNWAVLAACLAAVAMFTTALVVTAMRPH